MLIPRSPRSLVAAHLVCCVISAAILLAGRGRDRGQQPAPPPARLDTATATGETANFFNIRIHAQSGPLGEHPSGTVAWRAGGSEASRARPSHVPGRHR